MEGVQIDRTHKTVRMGDMEFNTEAIVTRHLDKSTAVAVFACTAGQEISRLAAEFNRKGHSIHAYLVDSLGSIVVERAMDLIQEGLKFAMQSENLQITNRYSPGYCGWDIREQKKLFDLLPPDFCGIRLSDTMLMKPVKSVSGFIGIGRNVTYDNYACGYCPDKNCIYRNKR
jgi:cobalamin-dependent methionine synthase I